MKVLTIFSNLILGITLLLPLSLPSSAQTRTDHFGAYLDWIFPTRNVGLNVAPAQTKSPTVKVKPRTDFFGPGDSGAQYDFYLDWMYPKRNVGLNPAPAPTKPLTAKVKPRTDYIGPGDSGAAYDFYLDWRSPRVKPKTPRTIQFLTQLITREKSDAESQVISQIE